MLLTPPKSGLLSWEEKQESQLLQKFVNTKNWLRIYSSHPRKFRQLGNVKKLKKKKKEKKISKRIVNNLLGLIMYYIGLPNKVTTTAQYHCLPPRQASTPSPSSPGPFQGQSPAFSLPQQQQQQSAANANNPATITNPTPAITTAPPSIPQVAKLQRSTTGARRMLTRGPTLQGVFPHRLGHDRAPILKAESHF